MSDDVGYFGPDSVSWQVHKEVTVLFGGARALLMQAAHPLVIAGAGQTGMFERNPWKRLQRTLILTYTLTFGTKAEADAAAERINEIHTRINGTDPVTGLQYDAPLAPRDRAGGLEHRGLADAGACFDQHDATAAYEGFDRREFRVAFDEVGHAANAVELRRITLAEPAHGDMQSARPRCLSDVFAALRCRSLQQALLDIRQRRAVERLYNVQRACPVCDHGDDSCRTKSEGKSSRCWISTES